MSKPLILELKEKLLTKILYENEQGSNENISLNENLENYDWIEIEIKSTDTEKIIKIDNPIGKSIYIELSYASGNNHVIAFSRFSIDSEKINVLKDNCGYYTIDYFNSNLNMNLDKINYIVITKVRGGKYYDKN